MISHLESFAQSGMFAVLCEVWRSKSRCCSEGTLYSPPVRHVISISYSGPDAFFRPLVLICCRRPDANDSSFYGMLSPSVFFCLAFVFSNDQLASVLCDD